MKQQEQPQMVFYAQPAEQPKTKKVSKKKRQTTATPNRGMAVFLDFMATAAVFAIGFVLGAALTTGGAA